MEKITRLYSKFQPEHYDIYVDVNREEKTITGKTTIQGNASEKQIAVHQKGLKVSSVKSSNNNLNYDVDDDNDMINIELPEAGAVEFSIEYQAKLTDSMMGIYPSYYEVNGEKKELVGTQFETNFARQAFPCVDEPEAKAKFNLAIKFDEKPGETAIANMPETKVEDGVHYFDETVRMSTYLVAFAFGDMQSKMTETKSGVKVGVFATKAHKANELDFALDIAKRAIEFYEDFYQTPYPLPHSWQLALPDFSAGAMENWGLVTYREALLLIDPDNTSLSTKQLVATVVTHELAHQWFGDLVTMRWWDDLWLNESFANMMEYVSVDALEPDWKIWETFQTSEAPAALQRDAIDGVQSVHVEVNHPAEIDALFDPAIVYAKGARMLVMVRALIGDDALRTGLKNYFAAHKYNNAAGKDLWDALGAASGIDLAKIMNSWLEQPGYPVVSASVEDGHLKLSQKQFFIGDGEDKGRQWQIPLNSNYADMPEIFKDATVDLGNYQELRQSNDKPFRVNVGNNSHFIVKYDQTLLNDILDHADELDSITKMQILQDLRLLAESRHISYASVIPVLSKFADSHSNVVNDALYRLAFNLKKFVDPDSEEEENLKHFMNTLSSDQVKRLGWTAKAGESNDDQLTRPTVLQASLYSEDEESVEAAHKIFEQNQDNLIGLPADTRVLVLANEIKNFSDVDVFEGLLDDYRHTSDPSYKSDICAALTATKDPKLLAIIVANFEDSKTIKPQDLRAWFRGVLANNEGQQFAWDWIRNEWQWLEDTVGGDMEFASFITVTSGIFHTRSRFDEFNEFFAPKVNNPGLTREIKMDTKSIETRVELVEAEKASVNDALAK
ncbi:M1 family metallopeptidase [Apilactobacillus apisilvae]|uniref:Aminopeptidase n=1 Tax=Apilactobacillus apisilvae TaxID=2923364 RepID=A0ABY4PGE2_9LACO|nr:M1 family metallopeptidase [Apilactobacillus apisilvae]UQS84860.1 M1 family metallopeptidase [Apilactobacillus apisilvae]